MATRRALRAEVTESRPRRSTVMPYRPPGLVMTSRSRRSLTSMASPADQSIEVPVDERVGDQLPERDERVGVPVVHAAVRRGDDGGVEGAPRPIHRLVEHARDGAVDGELVARPGRRGAPRQRLGRRLDDEPAGTTAAGRRRARGRPPRSACRRSAAPRCAAAARRRSAEPAPALRVVPADASGEGLHQGPVKVCGGRVLNRGRSNIGGLRAARNACSSRSDSRKSPS